MESSFKAFEANVEDLLYKMARFLRRHAPELYTAWVTTNTRWWSIVQQHIVYRMEQQESEAEEEDEIPDFEMILKPDEYNLDALLADSFPYTRTNAHAKILAACFSFTSDFGFIQTLITSLEVQVLPLP